MGGDDDTWGTIYDNLHLLRTKQSEVETLSGDRQTLKDRLFSLHDRWLHDLNCLQGQIAQMRAALAEAGMDRLLLEAKMDLVMAMSRKEAVACRMKSDDASSDLEALELVVRYLISKETEQKRTCDKQMKESGEDTSVDGQAEMQCRNLKGEIRKLKLANAKLTSEKNAELNCLIQERNFVWNQFKKMESDYSNLVKANCLELEQAIQKIAELQEAAEKSNVLIKEKDLTIDSLKERHIKQEKTMDDCSREVVCKLSEELKLLKSSGNLSSMQLRRCSQLKPISVNRESDDTGTKLTDSSDLLLTPSVKKVSWAELNCVDIKVEGTGRSPAKVKKEVSVLQASAAAITIEKGSRKRRKSDTMNHEDYFHRISRFQS